MGTLLLRCCGDLTGIMETLLVLWGPYSCPSGVANSHSGAERALALTSESPLPLHPLHKANAREEEKCHSMGGGKGDEHRPLSTGKFPYTLWAWHDGGRMGMVR